jgi:hypothetical protein
VTRSIPDARVISRFGFIDFERGCVRSASTLTRVTSRSADACDVIFESTDFERVRVTGHLDSVRAARPSTQGVTIEAALRRRHHSGRFRLTARDARRRGPRVRAGRGDTHARHHSARRCFALAAA